MVTKRILPRNTAGIVCGKKGTSKKKEPGIAIISLFIGIMMQHKTPGKFWVSNRVTGPFLRALQDFWTGAHGQAPIGMVVALEEREAPATGGHWWPTGCRTSK